MDIPYHRVLLLTAVRKLNDVLADPSLDPQVSRWVAKIAEEIDQVITALETNY